MTASTLYTMGYLRASSRRTLAELIVVRTPLVDIRTSPRSKRIEWTQEMLMQESDLMYFHIPDLGNDNYKACGFASIVIHDMDRGLASLEHILSIYGRACLLCACESVTTCHRLVVANEAARRFGLSIVHLPVTRKAVA